MDLSIKRKGTLDQILRYWLEKEAQFTCITNGEGILGFGDLGAKGMGYPVRKFQLCTATAGVTPQGVLLI